MMKRVATFAGLVSAMTAGALWVGTGEAWAGRACGANTGRNTNTNTTAPAPTTGTGAGAGGAATTAPAPAASPAPTAAPSGGGTTR